MQQRDRYGRLLAYVYVGQQLVNGELVHRGVAQAATYPPNVHYADYLRDLERRAREAKTGLWSNPAASAVLATPRVLIRAPSVPAPSSPSGSTPSDDSRANAHELRPGASSPPRSFSPAPAPATGGGDIQVEGYTKKDGTYVAPYRRRAPRAR